MRIRLAAAVIFFLVLATASCGIKQQVKGQYFLKTEKFEQGVSNFRAELAEDPNSPSANYFMGRFLLGEEKAQEAAAHFAKAVQFAPDNADYRFWLGVAEGETGEESAERRNYLAALKIDPDHLMSRTYLAHLQLKAGENEKALKNYERVLEDWPYSAQALYNRALILGRLGRTPEEKTAWKLYLAAWPEGPLARYATDHLNALGDFDYRNHVIGKRLVTLEKIAFEPLGSELVNGESASLDLVGEILERTAGLELHVIAYQLNNAGLARQRASAVSRYVRENFDIPASRIKASWFDQPEKIKADGKVFNEPESINIFAISKK